MNKMKITGTKKAKKVRMKTTASARSAQSLDSKMVPFIKVNGKEM